MSRKLPSWSAAGTVIAMLVTSSVAAAGDAKPESRPNPKMVATDALMRHLDQEISTKDLPRSFWALLDDLSERRGCLSSLTCGSSPKMCRR